MIQTNRAEWLKRRKSGIGGSDIGVVLGLSPYKTPLQLWLEKTEKSPTEEGTSEAAYWGNQLEDIIAGEYQKRTGREVQSLDETIRHPRFPFMIGHLDRVVLNPDIAESVQWDGESLSTDRILECKTTSAFCRNAWGENRIPTMYYLQVMWYMALTNTKYADVSVLIGGQEFRTVEIKREEALIDYLVREAEQFWDKVQQKIPPEPVTSTDLSLLYPESREQKSIEVSENVVQLCEQLAEVRKKEITIKKMRDVLECELKGVLQDAETLTFNGEKLASWKTRKSTTLNAARLREKKPEIAEEFSSQKSVRVFQLHYNPITPKQMGTANAINRKKIFPLE